MLVALNGYQQCKNENPFKVEAIDVNFEKSDLNRHFSRFIGIFHFVIAFSAAFIDCTEYIVAPIFNVLIKQKNLFVPIALTAAHVNNNEPTYFKILYSFFRERKKKQLIIQ